MDRDSLPNSESSGNVRQRDGKSGVKAGFYLMPGDTPRHTRTRQDSEKFLLPEQWLTPNQQVAGSGLGLPRFACVDAGEKRAFLRQVSKGLTLVLFCGFRL